MSQDTAISKYVLGCMLSEDLGETTVEALNTRSGPCAACCVFLAARQPKSDFVGQLAYGLRLPGTPDHLVVFRNSKSFCSPELTGKTDQVGRNSQLNDHSGQKS